MRQRSTITTCGLAMASALSSSAIHAGSSLTLFGVLDAGISHYRYTSDQGSDKHPGHSTRISTSKTALSNSGYTSSRLGFRGHEDLGGGYAVGFWLEAPLSNDDGGFTPFSRRSTISLMGPFGELRMGRDFKTTFWNDTQFDAMNTNGVGGNLIMMANLVNMRGGSGGFGGNPDYVRTSSAIAYFLPPDLGGVHGQLQYAFGRKMQLHAPPSSSPLQTSGEDAEGRKQTNGAWGARIGYRSGPLNVALAYGDTITRHGRDQLPVGRVRVANLSSTYDFGPAKIFAELSRSRSSHVDPDVPGLPHIHDAINGHLLGVHIPLGLGVVRAAYSQVRYSAAPGSTTSAPLSRKMALGYVHNISRQTALYATVAQIRNAHGAALGLGGASFVRGANHTARSATAQEFGIRHSF